MAVRRLPHESRVEVTSHVVSLAWAIALCVGCGPSPSAKEPSATAQTTTSPRRRSDALDPAKAPNATSVFNVTALRASTRTARTLSLLRVFLPEGESVDDVDWLAVDGPSPLASPTRNVIFIVKRSTEVRTVRGPRSGFTTVALPTPPVANELVRIDVRAPKRIIRVPFFEPPETVEELFVVAEAREDGGVDFRLRERCTDPTEAAKAAAALDGMVARLNRGGARALTQGMFADVKATVDGREARLDVGATPDQVEVIVELAVTLARGP